MEEAHLVNSSINSKDNLEDTVNKKTENEVINPENEKDENEDKKEANKEESKDSVITDGKDSIKSELPNTNKDNTFGDSKKLNEEENKGDNKGNSNGNNEESIKGNNIVDKKNSKEDIIEGNTGNNVKEITEGKKGDKDKNNNKDIKEDNIDDSEKIHLEVIKENKDDKKEDKKNNKGLQKEEGLLKKENENKINDIITLLEKISNKYSKDLESYSINYSSKIKRFIGDLNDYKDDLLNKSNFVDKNSNKEDNKDINLSIEEYIQLIGRILELFIQMFSTVEKSLEIIFKFLEISKDINKKNPIDEFLLNEFEDISNCWFFKQIDFKKFDLNKALERYDLQPNFKNFISKEYEKKKFALDIIYPKGDIIDQKEQKKLKEKKEKDIKLLEENKSNIIKLRMENAGNVTSYLNNHEFKKLKKLYVENTILQQPNIFKKMPNLEKLTLKSIPNLQIEIFEFLPSKLKKIYLEKNNFVNYDLENLLKGFFSNNKNILSNLEYLSFAGNNITKADLCVISTKIIFHALKEINFYKNNIYKLIMNPHNFPNLKFINCCKNNLNKSYLSQMKNIGSLESENGFLFDPEICQNYYNDLKKKLIKNEKDLYRTNYLNISYMPKVQTLKYFDEFIINEQIRINLRKLDLSNNELNCNTFFKFANQNKAFENLKTLNLNGNELDDTFFEKFLIDNKFCKLQHLYLNSNRIGDTNILVNYKDDIPLDSKLSDKNLIYKLRLLYKFIELNIYLNKLTITKNPIGEFYSIIPEKNNNADKSDKYIKKDANNKIIINCLFSLLIKIRDELPKEENKRNNFNLRFDCRSNVNRNSENYPYADKPIVYKKNN